MTSIQSPLIPVETYFVPSILFRTTVLLHRLSTVAATVVVVVVVWWW